MERVVTRKTIQAVGAFTPSQKIGSVVRPNDTLGHTRVPVVLEVHSLENGRVLVDDGVFVTDRTPLVEYKKGFRREIVGSMHEGIVRVSKTAVSIVAEDTEEPVTSPLWGRILSVAENSYTLEVKYLKMPIFVSRGFKVEGLLHGFLQKGAITAPHHITDEVREKIVLLPGAVTKETYHEIMNRGAMGVLAPSVDWNDYLDIFSNPNGNVGILHGFGMFPLWRWYYHLLSKMHNVLVEVDYATSFLYIPISDILMGSLEQDLLLFKEYWWGKQVKSLQHESGDLIATLETGEQTPVMAEELFNIR